mgnify:CR=1 FL=1
MPLTSKQEAFAQAIAILGVDQSKAYRLAYDVSPLSATATTNDSASKLAANPLVAQRIAQLRANAQQGISVSAAQIIEKLKAIAFADPDRSRIRPSDQVAALDKMAKILGLYRDVDVDRPRQVITHVTVVLDHGGGPPGRIEGEIVDEKGTTLTAADHDNRR